MPLNANQIIERMKLGQIRNANIQCVNGASLDVRLQEHILVEIQSKKFHIADPYDPNTQNFAMERIPRTGLILKPGSFILGATVESLELPDSLAADFMLKSTIARMGLEHAKAGWIDPGFHGTITLELKVVTQFHAFKIYPNMLIGQLVFHKLAPVGEKYSYQSIGRYNNQTKPRLGKGVKKVQ